MTTRHHWLQVRLIVVGSSAISTCTATATAVAATLTWRFYNSLYACITPSLLPSPVAITKCILQDVANTFSLVEVSLCWEDEGLLPALEAREPQQLLRGATTLAGHGAGGGGLRRASSGAAAAAEGLAEAGARGVHLTVLVVRWVHDEIVDDQGGRLQMLPRLCL